ncbi:SPW repeat protein [Allokutzneria sp. NRRL B-24872]|uniref:SPW repeat domain-containing protein n=1 Tax=Allokutzneria sp. NRRL B-24872 TaxID=1137961 RepID=UPI001178C6BD|nr:SPW repeat protein [Allokutzneria sp. NRRL B-24872]
MSDTRARSWTRVQDWVSLMAGAVIASFPLWLKVGTAGSWAMVIIGVVIGGLALGALAMPGAYIDEWVMAAAGVAMLVAPWLFSYVGNNTATWTSWVIGVVVVVSTLTALPASREVHRRHHMA